MRSRLMAGGVTLAALFLIAAPASAGLIEYVKKPEPDYRWKLKDTKKSDAGTVYELHLVSQKWEGIVWEHGLVVYQPTAAQPAGTMLLINTGGNPGGQFAVLGLELAKRIGAPVAVLYNIPNQPLFGGKKEDALIAETFVRFLDTGGKDEDWPLLFPMAKSVCKAMDALQDFSKDQLKVELKDFVISGASKRGWTTWLTGAADPRVRAIAPMVIDVLNMNVQMKHQLECFGKYSEMIHDYEERGLLPAPDTAAARKLWSMVDPYAYRDRLIMPKLIINGANDPYWTTDALNFYWNDLKGEKAVVIVPNAGHNLAQKFDDGKPDPLRSTARVVNALAAFTRAQIAGKSLPEMSWKHEESKDGRLWLEVKTSETSKAARLWVAKSESRDFRKSKWEEKAATVAEGGKKVVGICPPPESGWLAFYGEVDFEDGGVKYSLATQMRVEKAK